MRFTIRDLLSLTVVAGVAFAWFVDHHRMSVYNFLAWEKVKSLRKDVDELEEALAARPNAPILKPSAPSPNQSKK
ncbi:MAG TPA: hypothetical protein VFB96_22420 [Pirellulaceae bacterium]|nr:hypothetical protein [Pirellulaceae bacterium]